MHKEPAALRSPLAVRGGRWGRGGRLQPCSLQTPRWGLTSPFFPSHHGYWSNQLPSTSTSPTSTTPRELSATGLQSPAWWSRGELLSGAFLLCQALCWVFKPLQKRMRPKSTNNCNQSWLQGAPEAFHIWVPGLGIQLCTKFPEGFIREAELGKSPWCLHLLQPCSFPVGRLYGNLELRPEGLIIPEAGYLETGSHKPLIKAVSTQKTGHHGLGSTGKRLGGWENRI